MIHRPIEQITEADLLALIQEEVREDRSLDYKESLPGSGGDATREFAADVAALANTTGGDLIFGVREKRDTQGRATGLPESIVGIGAGVNVDQTVLRLENMLRDGVAPRITGVRMRAVAAAASAILVVRVPASWSAPHMVKANGRFYGRNSAGKFELDVQQIRDAFLRSTGLAERLRAFRSDRLIRIKSGESPVPVEAGPLACLHIVSFDSLGTARLLDIHDLWEHPERLPPMGAGGWNHRTNMDGLVLFTGAANQPSRAYTQVFRTGGVEALDASLVRREDGGVPWFGSIRLEQRVLDYTDRAIRTLVELGASHPFAAMLTVTDARGLRVRMERGVWDEPDFQGLDRDDLVLPEVVLEDPSIDMGRALRPMFDTLWQAVGWDRSKNYGDDGAWRPHGG